VLDGGSISISIRTWDVRPRSERRLQRRVDLGRRIRIRAQAHAPLPLEADLQLALRTLIRCGARVITTTYAIVARQMRGAIAHQPVRAPVGECTWNSPVLLLLAGEAGGAERGEEQENSGAPDGQHSAMGCFQHIGVNPPRTPPWAHPPPGQTYPFAFVCSSSVATSTGRAARSLGRPARAFTAISREACRDRFEG